MDVRCIHEFIASVKFFTDEYYTGHWAIIEYLNPKDRSLIGLCSWAIRLAEPTMPKIIMLETVRSGCTPFYHRWQPEFDDGKSRGAASQEGIDIATFTWQLADNLHPLKNKQFGKPSKIRGCAECETLRAPLTNL